MRTTHRTGLAVALLMAVATSGCTLHMPASELLMFRDAKPMPPRRTVDAMAISYTALPLGPAPYDREANRRFKRGPSYSVELANALRKGVMVSPVWIHDGGRSAFSLSVGSAAGMDLTRRFRNTYFTLAGSAAGVETIAQWKLGQSNYAASAIGVAVRYEKFLADVSEGSEGGDNLSFWPYTDFPVASMGVRFTGIATDIQRTSLLARVIVYWGYAPAMRHTEFRVGVSVGAF